MASQWTITDHVHAFSSKPRTEYVAVRRFPRLMAYLDKTNKWFNTYDKYAGIAMTTLGSLIDEPVTWNEAHGVAIVGMVQPWITVAASVCAKGFDFHASMGSGAYYAMVLLHWLYLGMVIDIMYKKMKSQSERLLATHAEGPHVAFWDSTWSSVLLALLAVILSPSSTAFFWTLAVGVPAILAIGVAGYRCNICNRNPIGSSSHPRHPAVKKCPRAGKTIGRTTTNGNARNQDYLDLLDRLEEEHEDVLTLEAKAKQANKDHTRQLGWVRDEVDELNETVARLQDDRARLTRLAHKQDDLVQQLQQQLAKNKPMLDVLSVVVVEKQDEIFQLSHRNEMQDIKISERDEQIRDLVFRTKDLKKRERLQTQEITNLQEALQVSRQAFFNALQQVKDWQHQAAHHEQAAIYHEHQAACHQHEAAHYQQQAAHYEQQALDHELQAAQQHVAHESTLYWNARQRTATKNVVLMSERHYAREIGLRDREIETLCDGMRDLEARNDRLENAVRAWRDMVDDGVEEREVEAGDADESIVASVEVDDDKDEETEDLEDDATEDGADVEVENDIDRDKSLLDEVDYGRVTEAEGGFEEDASTFSFCESNDDSENDGKSGGSDDAGDEDEWVDVDEDVCDDE